jgi:hypothetical protein
VAVEHVKHCKSQARHSIVAADKYKPSMHSVQLLELGPKQFLQIGSQASHLNMKLFAHVLLGHVSTHSRVEFYPYIGVQKIDVVTQILPIGGLP